MKKCDVLLITVPDTDTLLPLQAPAVLKAALEKHQFTAHTYDVNIDFQRMKDDDTDKWNLLKNYFSFGTVIDSENLTIIEAYVDEVVNQLQDTYDFNYIGISVFSYQCQHFTKMFCEKLKLRSPYIQIILGGQGLLSQGLGSNDEWVNLLKRNNLIDHYIISEGENAIVQLLTEGKGKGVDNLEWEQQLNMDANAFPDYTDYKFELYREKILMITGSRGCVRRCTFCDIHNHWQRFVFRSGDSIANEMISQSERYGIYHFSFTDSLVNGSMKAYRDFVTKLAEYNSTAENKISWDGQIITRGIKAMTAEDWRLTALSGADDLASGVESGSERVRDHMKKQFSNQDLDEFVHEAHKNGVTLQFLMIIGYPTETHEDFLETLRMFKRYKKYDNLVSKVYLGSTLGVLPGTPLATEHTHELELNNGENFWVYDKNPTLTFKERIKRRIIAGEELKKMGYTIGSDDNHLKLLHFLWNVNQKQQSQAVVDLNTSSINDQKYS